jgi:hypothetical protein
VGSLARSLVAALLVAGLATGAAADLDGSTYESATWQVRLTAPRNWQLSERTSYPNVLLWMSRRSPRGRMLFSAERLPAGEGALEYARRSAEKLATLGFRVRAPQLHSATGAYWIELENRTAFLRQAFLVSGQTGYTLTLAADSARDRSQHLRAFDATLRSIRAVREGEPSRREAPPDGDEADDDVSGAAGPAPGASPAPAPAVPSP